MRGQENNRGKDKMGTIPPEVADVDKWLTESGAMKGIISAAYTPGHGFHVKAFVVGYTTNAGVPQFSILTGDPTNDPVVAKQLYGLVGEFGDITLRVYDYTEPLPSISPQGMAAMSIEQARIANMDNWMPSRT